MTVQGIRMFPHRPGDVRDQTVIYRLQRAQTLQDEANRWVRAWLSIRLR